MNTRIRSPRRLLTAIIATVALLASGCGANDAVQTATASNVEFTIESGALARQLRGQTIELIPTEIELVAGQSIVIHNEDQALHYFLDSPIWPGETLTKQFDEPGTFRYSGAFTCSIGSGTSLTVLVRAAMEASRQS